METHVHSHHEGKRTWKSLVKEFLMLFLAVFCGFLAEYYLEHRVESEREEKYMASLVSDLKADTAMIRKTILIGQTISIGLDSLQANLYHFTAAQEQVQRVYRQNFSYLKWILPDFNDRTASQLKYSGNFRLIRNSHVSDLLANYWIEIAKISRNAELFIEKSALAQESGNTIFNKQYTSFPENADGSYNMNYILVSPDAQLMTTDKNTLIAYANRIGRMTDIAEHYLIPLLRKQLTKANELIRIIEEEYPVN
jgi:hypothetical protein